jgi:hypothetical protein
MHALQSCQPKKTRRENLLSSKRNFHSLLLLMSTSNETNQTHASSSVTRCEYRDNGVVVRDASSTEPAFMPSGRRHLQKETAVNPTVGNSFTPFVSTLAASQRVSVLKRQSSILTKCFHLFHKLDVNICFHKCHILTSAKQYTQEKGLLRSK